MLRRLLPVNALALAIVSLGALAPTGAAKKKPPSHPININTASSSELQLVPGIGPATAEKILQTRKSYGSFKTVDDLLSIRGIGPKRLEKMRKYLTVGKAAGKSTTASSTATGSSARNKAAPKAATVTSAPAKPAAKEKTEEASEEEEPK